MVDRETSDQNGRGDSKSGDAAHAESGTEIAGAGEREHGGSDDDRHEEKPSDERAQPGAKRQSDKVCDAAGIRVACR